MNAVTRRLIVALLPFLTLTPRALMAQEQAPVSVEARLDELQSQINSLKTVIEGFVRRRRIISLRRVLRPLGSEYGRNPWLWFFAGIIFSFVTILVLLAKNSDDRRALRSP